MPKLKVFRTPIGFHDAYVAAPSQKAALKAWGSDTDLFARGIAEVVTDEALMAELLASPGKVIRKLRGTADEQLEAAKMPDRPKRRPRCEDEHELPRCKRTGSGKRQAARARLVPPPAPPPPSPRPSRAALDAAERATEEMQVRQLKKIATGASGRTRSRRSGGGSTRRMTGNKGGLRKPRSVPPSLREGGGILGSEGLSRCHADFTNPFEFATFLRMADGLVFDVMMEGRSKDFSLLRLRPGLLRFAPDVAVRFGITAQDASALAVVEARLNRGIDVGEGRTT